MKPYSIDKDLIRLGPKGDGGYLVPDDLSGIKACFSPGVGQISRFEEECSKLGMQLFLADKSVHKINTDLPDDKYSFLQKYVGDTNNTDFITLDEWVNSSLFKDDSDLLLQMDIEGSEYVSIINVSDSLMKRFRILVIEFHYLQKLWNPVYFDFAEVVFNKILQTHTCIHIHPNNYRGIDTQFGVEIPRTAEFSFIRNDRINIKKYQTKFPHKSDYDNHKNRQHITLPRNWY